MQQKMATPPLVVPITQPEVDWGTFYNITKQELGYSVLGNGDAKGVPPRTPLAFAFALATMVERDCDLNKALYDASGHLRHLSFAFMVAADRTTILESIVETKLNATYKYGTERDLAVISGTLAEWREAIVHCSRRDKSFNTRYVFNSCLLFFEQAGLSMIWYNYRKVKLSDGSLVLELK